MLGPVHRSCYVKLNCFAKCLAVIYKVFIFSLGLKLLAESINCIPRTNWKPLLLYGIEYALGTVYGLAGKPPKGLMAVCFLTIVLFKMMPIDRGSKCRAGKMNGSNRRVWGCRSMPRGAWGRAARTRSWYWSNSIDFHGNCVSDHGLFITPSHPPRLASLLSLGPLCGTSELSPVI